MNIITIFNSFSWKSRRKDEIDEEIFHFTRERQSRVCLVSSSESAHHLSYLLAARENGQTDGDDVGNNISRAMDTRQHSRMLFEWKCGIKDFLFELYFFCSDPISFDLFILVSFQSLLRRFNIVSVSSRSLKWNIKEAQKQTIRNMMRRCWTVLIASQVETEW